MVTCQKNGDLNYFAPKAKNLAFIFFLFFGLTVNTDMLKIAPVLLDIPWMSASLK